MSNQKKNAMLVCLNISQWTGRKDDRSASKKLTTMERADPNAAVVRKNLVGRSLAGVSAAAGALRAYHAAHTRPWLDGGTRVLPPTLYMDYARDTTKLVEKFNAEVSKFLSEYDRVREDAVKSLGDLFDPLDYPSDIAAKFSAKITYLPFPDSSDFRLDIAELDTSMVEARLAEIAESGDRELVERMLAVVSKAKETLATPDKIFRDTLVSNLAETSEIVEKLNISENTCVSELAQEVKQLAGSVDPDTLRKDTAARSSAAAKLAKIQAKLEGF